MAVSALVAVGSVADELVQAIANRIPAVKIGPGNEPEAEMGPLITQEHRDRVAGYVERAQEAGAVAVIDGAAADLPSDGFFYGPTLLDEVTSDMECYQDEIFGPVLSVVRVDTFREAIDLINSNPFGNGTCYFHARRRSRPPVPTRSASRNGRNQRSDPSTGRLPLIWRMESISIRRHTHVRTRRSALYTRAKAITARWPDPASSQVDLGFPQNQ